MSYYYKILLFVLYPFSFTIILLLFWTVYKFVRQKTFLFALEGFLITNGMTLFFFLSPIINLLSSYLNCTEINGEKHLTNFLIEKCENNPRYEFWKNYFVIPSFVIFGFLIPFSMFYYMYKRKRDLYEEIFRYKIGFLLNGYTSINFYWLFYFLFKVYLRKKKGIFVFNPKNDISFYHFVFKNWIWYSNPTEQWFFLPDYMYIVLFVANKKPTISNKRIK